ncbi:MAG: hypothetical protein IPH18_12065 [Chitinophagaceae bacterium]|nr:hypothetical protein [Chitinophagaceae bacterium]
MKKILLLLFVASTLATYAQKTDITNVNSVKPKKGQKMAFEAAYKVHIAKFHKAEEKLTVYEIMTGKYAGFYHLVNGGMSLASFDKERADATTHSLDLDKTFFPYLEETKNGVYRWMDSLSFHSDMKAERFLVNVRTIKSSVQADYRTELKRSVVIANMMKGKFWDALSLNVYEQLWDGSEPIVVTIRNLKDGVASLETDFYGPQATATFKDEYIKTYGTLDWDKRDKLMTDAVENNEQYIMKLRSDLSSQ